MQEITNMENVKGIKDFKELKVLDAFLRRNLSYDEFFSRYYDPNKDGRVVGATYSFSHKDFGFWSRLKPFSIIYVNDKYRKKVEEFIKRFPLFVVYIAPELHTKAFFFMDSCKLLLGSENLYSPISSYEEMMCELWLDVENEGKRDEVLDFIFDFRSRKCHRPESRIHCVYSSEDIRVHKNKDLLGRVFLPCHREVTYWDLASKIIDIKNFPNFPEKEFHQPGYIYVVTEYVVDDFSYYLAFDRGYLYSGDLSNDAFKWLHTNVEIEGESEGGFLNSIGNLSSAPFKDHFLYSHPMNDLKCAYAKRTYTFGRVKNLDDHTVKLFDIPLKVKDISSNKKIRRSTL